MRARKNESRSIKPKWQRRFEDGVQDLRAKGKLSDFGKSVKKSLGDEDVSSEDETLQEFQKRFEESKKQKTPEPAEEKKKKKRKNDEEVPEVAPPKPKKVLYEVFPMILTVQARLEHVSQVKTETAPQVQEGLTGKAIILCFVKFFSCGLQRTTGKPPRYPRSYDNEGCSEALPERFAANSKRQRSLQRGSIRHLQVEGEG